MSEKFALIIANTEYTDPGLAQLTAPGKDAEDFARVLKAPGIGGFDKVTTLINEDATTARESIDEFFTQKKPDDLLVLYFSGHGVRDEFGTLYLAVKNTNRSLLRSTGIKSDFIRDAMNQSRSKRQVLILDCCNSGAFDQGSKAATGVSIGTASAFSAGYGHIILTASDSTQFAWEGDKVIGETTNSLFTHYLIEGLEGEADRDSDGRITVDELYDYAFEKVRLATPKQTPSKFSNKQQGEIILRQGRRIEDIKPVSLSDQLTSEIESLFPEVRLRAVEQLAKLLNGKNLGLARSAREALENISAEDDSRRVAQVATQVLDERKAKDEIERIAAQKAEEERLARERAEQEQKVKEEAERIAAQKAEEERLTREKVVLERTIREEAERLIAEERRQAREKAAARRAAKAAEERLALEKAEAERIAREKAENERKEKEEAERIEREKAEAERKAKAEAERLARIKAETERKEKEAREEAERIQQYIWKLQRNFAQHVRGWGNWKTDEAQVRQNIRLDNATLDLYFDGKGYLFTPLADHKIIEKAAKLARYTNIYVIAYEASDSLLEMVRHINGVEIYRLIDRTKTSNSWSWFDFEIFIASPTNLSNALK